MQRFKKIGDWAIALMAIWTALSPAIYSFSNGGGFVVFTGIVLIVLGIMALARPEAKAVEWCIAGVSLFLFFVPWIFGFRGGAAVNTWIISAVMVALSGMSLPWLYSRKSVGETR